MALPFFMGAKKRKKIGVVILFEQVDQF